MGRLLGDPEVWDDSPARPRPTVRGLAGLAVGVSPVASAGVTAANTFSNLTTLLSAVNPQANAPLYLVLTPAAARSLALKADSAGGKVFDQLGIPRLGR